MKDIKENGFLKLTDKDLEKVCGGLGEEERIDYEFGTGYCLQCDEIRNTVEYYRCYPDGRREYITSQCQICSFHWKKE